MRRNDDRIITTKKEAFDAIELVFVFGFIVGVVLSFLIYMCCAGAV